MTSAVQDPVVPRWRARLRELYHGSSPTAVRFRLWVLLGIPAFFGLVVVFYLMVAKPI